MIITELTAFLFLGLFLLFFIIGFIWKLKNFVMFSSFMLFALAMILFINPLQYSNGSNQTISYNYFNQSYVQNQKNFDNLGILQTQSNTTIQTTFLLNETITETNNYVKYDVRANIIFILVLIILGVLEAIYSYYRFKLTEE